jgi:hypothetical protein
MRSSPRSGPFTFGRRGHWGGRSAAVARQDRSRGGALVRRAVRDRRGAFRRGTGLVPDRAGLGGVLDAAGSRDPAARRMALSRSQRHGRSALHGGGRYPDGVRPDGARVVPSGHEARLRSVPRRWDVGRRRVVGRVDLVSDEPAGVACRSGRCRRCRHARFLPLPRRPLRLRRRAPLRDHDVRVAAFLDLHIPGCARGRPRWGACGRGSDPSPESPRVPRSWRGSGARTWPTPGASAPTSSSSSSSSSSSESTG